MLFIFHLSDLPILCLCKGVKIIHFSSEIIFGQPLETFGDFFSGHTGRNYRSIIYGSVKFYGTGPWKASFTHLPSIGVRHYFEI